MEWSGASINWNGWKYLIGNGIPSTDHTVLDYLTVLFTVSVDLCKLSPSSQFIPTIRGACVGRRGGIARTSAMEGRSVIGI